MADEDPNDAVLSDVEGDDDPIPIVLPSPSPSASTVPSPSAATIAAAEQRVRDLLAELEKERGARKSAEGTFNRLKSLAHDAIRQRDEALRDKEEAVRRRDEAIRDKEEAARSAERTVAELSDALRLKDEASKQKDSLRSEMETAAQMLLSGIGKISGKVSGFKNFSASGGLPTSQKYTGLPAVAYGVIKRANEIAEELMKQIDASSKARDQAREQVEQRNYEIAIEVSQLEAAIVGLREEASKKTSEIESLEKMVAERGSRISEMEDEISKLRQHGDDRDAKIKGLETKLESQRPLIFDQLNYTSKAYGQIREILKCVDKDNDDLSESSDSLFMWEEMDVDDNLRSLLDGTKSVYELASVAAEKVRDWLEDSNNKVNDLNEKVMELLAEKQHIGTLLRSALSSKTDEVLHVAEEGLREVGIELILDRHDEHDSNDSGENEVYILADALGTTVKESQIKIIELQHLVEALRAECSLLKSRLDAQAKEISQLKHHIKQLEEKERSANENVEGLMMDIAAAEEEITRWKLAAEQEAAAGRAVEQEFQLQLSALRKELDDAQQAAIESENKLKFKEETAAAAMAARDAAEKSLRLADIRSTRLRERLEELTRQLEESDNQDDLRNRNGYRYVCWPWQWLGLNLVRYHQTDVQQDNNEMELSEPLV
ncbi:unnamed protein product [Musa acuminata subsp. malaccensis]|uniref:(wild Malaysian banana) hypothetical protein n=1 Tax=Musa acuminata subsp. malaccensis TaxID=214687 RepID=A0A804HYH2_MUSAM|nr:PREDICTED: uncharacterized protein At3g49055 [Musa acuminata subsp. malaccensis]CAG1860876.1 unnamed protein product [Musa acuminata subsp. malaccensis]